MIHRLLCRLYFHAWPKFWTEVWGGEPSYFPARCERQCLCCGAREFTRYEVPSR